jgi:PAS domain S-box-containing protein
MTNTLSYEHTMQFIEGLDAMAVLNKDGVYLYVNPGWCALTGLTPEQALGRRVWEILPDPAPKRCWRRASR